MSFRYPVYIPELHGNEKKYVNECLDTTWISSRGKFVKKFEDEFAKYLSTPYATTVCNGTVALHLALLALGIKAGDEVIVPTLTYIATVNAISYVGATPVFIDSEKEFWQIDLDDIRQKITSRTKAVLTVHLFGGIFQIEELARLCKENNLFLIEDCSESIGSTSGGIHSGNFGDIATFSFFGNKTITTGEGGMVTSRSKQLIDKVAHLKNQGVSPQVQYWHDTIGYNYRMTNICAAIGLAQLENIDAILKRKKCIAKAYQKAFEGSSVLLQPEAVTTNHSYWMCSILLPENVNRDDLRSYLSGLGIETRPVFYPVHAMPMYSGFAANQHFPVAEQLAQCGISIPSYPSLLEEDVVNIAGNLLKFVNKHE